MRKLATIALAVNIGLAVSATASGPPKEGEVTCTWVVPIQCAINTLGFNKCVVSGDPVCKPDISIGSGQDLILFEMVQKIVESNPGSNNCLFVEIEEKTAVPVNCQTRH